MITSKHSEKKHTLRFEHWHAVAACLIIYDLIALHAAWFVALWARYDFVFSGISFPYLRAYKLFITPYSVACVLLFLIVHLYRSMLRFASYRELIKVLGLSLLTSLLHIVLIGLVIQRMPISYYVMGTTLQTVLLVGIRFSFRLAIYIQRLVKHGADAQARVMLIGAGEAGQIILRDIRNAREIHEHVVCIIDDNPNKWNRYIEGVPIVGGRDDILTSVEKYKIDKIYLAIPSARAEDKKEILGICKESGCELKSLPGLYQLALGQVSVSDMKEVSIEDLLGRDPIRPDMKEVFDFVNGKVVLVTGGGGSIGSELCRQIAAHAPKQLVIFDIYENNAYAIQLELREKYPALNLEVLIGSVRDYRRLEQVFRQYRPQIVYHAAAHKHVPLMEDSPNESIKNNAFGTYKTAYAALTHGCERFVLISTDKAVNPTNIMGASKRLCEMIIQSFDAMIKAGRAQDIPHFFHIEDDVERALQHPLTEFVAVRFGNVLGSNGSVVPIFKRQIEQGGPVTVTHPDIIRYFMTVPEAVSLVMLAGTFAHGGEIFVLDMGDPVKIDTLARNLIKLSGFVPDEDIKIVYTGLRPGEKLYEEKLMAEEGLKKTDNKLIHIGCPIPFETKEFLNHLPALLETAESNSDKIRDAVQALVSTYHPAPPEVTIVKDRKYVSLVKDTECAAHNN